MMITETTFQGMFGSAVCDHDTHESRSIYAEVYRRAIAAARARVCAGPSNACFLPSLRMDRCAETSNRNNNFPSRLFVGRSWKRPPKILKSSEMGNSGYTPIDIYRVKPEFSNRTGQARILRIINAHGCRKMSEEFPLKGRSQSSHDQFVRVLQGESGARAHGRAGARGRAGAFRAPRAGARRRARAARRRAGARQVPGIPFFLRLPVIGLEAFP